MKVIAAISEELFDRQPEAYRRSVLPPEAYEDLMFVSTGTRRGRSALGPQNRRDSLTSDQENKWLTGGTQQDVIAEARLDAKSIFNGVQRFAQERPAAWIACAQPWRRWTSPSGSCLVAVSGTGTPASAAFPLS